MPDLQSTAGKVEAAFKTVLSNAAALSGVNIRAQNEDTDLALPAVVLAAEKTRTVPELYYGGKYGEEIDLRVICIVADNVSGSSAKVEDVAADAKAAIEGATISSGWTYLDLDWTGDNRAEGNGRRVIELQAACIALPSA